MVVFMDGFDSYSSYTDISRRWWGGTSSSVSFPAGRYGGKAITGTGGAIMRANLPILSTFTIGFGIYVPSLFSSAQNIMSLWDQSDNHFWIRIEPVGMIEVIGRDNSNNETWLVWSPPSTIKPGTYHYVEFQLVCSTGAGYAELRVDSEVISTFSGTTIFFNQSQISSLQIYGQSFLYDDLYVTNSTAPNSGFLGDVKMALHTSTGTGRVMQWIPQGISNSTAAVSGMDNDATYIHTESVSGMALFTFSSLASGCADVKAAQLILATRKSTPGPQNAAGVVGNGATEVINTAYGLWDVSYSHKLYIYDTDPITAASWVPANFNTRQFGIIAQP